MTLQLKNGLKLWSLENQLEKQLMTFQFLKIQEIYSLAKNQLR